MALMTMYSTPENIAMRTKKQNNAAILIIKQDNRTSHFVRVLCVLPSPQAATEWSRLLLHDVIFSERVTIRFQWGEKPLKLPLPLGISSPSGRGPSHGHRQHAQKNW